VNLGPWSGINDSHYKLALALLQVPLGEPKLVNALTVLAEYLDSAKADQILSIVAPTWVDPRAARWLADCGRRGDNKPAVMLNGSTHFCAAMYIHRASCRPPKTRWRIVQVTGVHGEHTAEEIAAEMEQNLISELRLVADSFAENARESLRERLMVLLRDLQNGGHPVFVVLQFSAVIATVLTELQQLLPAVTFVLLSGIDFPPSDLLHDQRVKLVEPKLEPGLEERAQSDFDYARSIVRPGQAGAY